LIDYGLSPESFVGTWVKCDSYWSASLTERTHKQSEAGFALLAAVIFLSMLLLLTAAVILTSGVARSVSREALVRSQAQALGDAVIFQVAQELQDGPASPHLRIDGSPTSITVLGIHVALTIDSEFGKIDLNAAPTQVLARLFIYAGMPQIDAQNLAVSVARARAQAASTSVGADQTQAPELRLTFRLTNELLYLSGASPALLNAIDAAVTTDSGHNMIDPSTAPLAALVASESMPPEQAQEIVRERRALPDTEVWNSATGNGQSHAAVDLRGWPLRLRARYDLSNRSFEIDTIIRLVGAAGNGFLTSHYHFAESD